MHTELLNKIRSLSPEKVKAVERFVDLLENEQHLVQSATSLSEDAFRKVWDNPEDADYDSL